MSSRLVSSLPLSAANIAQLMRAGYSTVHDLKNISVETLAQDLKISPTDAESILGSLSNQITTTTQSLSQPTLTQSAASIAKLSQRKFSTRTPGVDELLLGGLTSGQTLEISGPPGTPKELIAINIVASFLEAGREVIFIDLQNMTSPATLDKMLRKIEGVPSDFSRRIFHSSIHSLLELMVFIHNLPKTLESNPEVALLVLNSISFPLQGSQDLTYQSRTAILVKIKQALTLAAATRGVTIVTTSQLSTKMLNADGSAGSFDTGARGVMVPQLGLAYLPGRAYRIILIAKGQDTGLIKLLSTPENPKNIGADIPLTVPYQVTSEGDFVISVPDHGHI